MNGGVIKNLVLAIALVSMAAGLSACGRKGPLEAPSAGVEGNKPAATKSTGEKVPERDFILDGMI